MLTALALLTPHHSTVGPVLSASGPSRFRTAHCLTLNGPRPGHFFAKGRDAGHSCPALYLRQDAPGVPGAGLTLSPVRAHSLCSQSPRTAGRCPLPTRVRPRSGCRDTGPEGSRFNGLLSLRPRGPLFSAGIPTAAGRGRVACCVPACPADFQIGSTTETQRAQR